MKRLFSRSIGPLLVAALVFALVGSGCESEKGTHPTAPSTPVKPPPVQDPIVHNRAGQRYETPHFRISYPSLADSVKAFEVAKYSEDIYRYVDSLHVGCAPKSITEVALSTQFSNYSTGRSIVLYLDNGQHMKQIFGHEFGHVVFYHLTDARGYRYDVLNEGASVLIEIRYEKELGAVEPWELRGYWASKNVNIAKNELSDWDSRRDQLGSIFYSIGHTFVLRFRERYGAQKWVDLVRNLPGNDLHAAFSIVGLNYSSFFDDWISFLASSYDLHASVLSKVPSIRDSLMIQPTDSTRSVRVKVFVNNGEASRYPVSFSVIVNGAFREWSSWSYSSKAELVFTVGDRLLPGTKIEYDAVVSSQVLMTWMSSGWKRLTLQ